MIATLSLRALMVAVALPAAALWGIEGACFGLYEFALTFKRRWKEAAE